MLALDLLSYLLLPFAHTLTFPLPPPTLPTQHLLPLPHLLRPPPLPDNPHLRPPGPPNPTATALLKQLTDQLSAGGTSYERIGNHTESAEGIVARFTKLGEDVEGAG